MSVAAVVTFLVIFVAVLAAYGIGQCIGQRSSPDGVRRSPDGKVTPVEILLHYRNASGLTTLRKVKVLGFVPRRGGRSCLFAVGNSGTEPRTFRIDRIATSDGKPLGTQQFLTEWLGVAT
ncbi:MAG: hypothetical protein P8Y71_25300 [Pseudolabrys sp.]